MKKGFPNRILGIPYGWSDRGYVKAEYLYDDVYTHKVCRFCRSKAKIGIERNEVFAFCRKCKTILVEPKI